LGSLLRRERGKGGCDGRPSRLARLQQL
jgi:hypothetical protein